ncbi:hypothetical protein [Rhizobium rhizosphaerae]|uniref:hypothetical protein n=1 Tax=Xaviernesmea rhizosphaerae TaxID=1672749 RepID=UPI001592CF10|nr:hypothetical protein [Xaviernesmea rhizosphaerae]
MIDEVLKLSSRLPAKEDAVQKMGMTRQAAAVATVDRFMNFAVSVSGTSRHTGANAASRIDKDTRRLPALLEHAPGRLQPFGMIKAGRIVAPVLHLAQAGRNRRIMVMMWQCSDFLTMIRLHPLAGWRSGPKTRQGR